jgi:hypothetical protein
MRHLRSENFDKGRCKAKTMIFLRQSLKKRMKKAMAPPGCILRMTGTSVAVLVKSGREIGPNGVKSLDDCVKALLIHLHII